MHREEVADVLNKPLALELMSSDIPARVAYTGLDGAPRVVPIGFHWSGTEIIISTVPGSYKVRALAADPRVALTIDTTGRHPPHVLLVRGTAVTELVEGVPAEYVQGGRSTSPTNSGRHSRPRCGRSTSRWSASRSRPSGQSCWTSRPRSRAPWSGWCGSVPGSSD